MSTISACVHTLVCLILMKFQLGTDGQFISKHKLEMSNNRGLITCIWFRPCDSPGVCLIYVFRAIVETKLETKLVEFYILLLNFTANSNGYTPPFAQQQQELGSTSYDIISVHPSIQPLSSPHSLTAAPFIHPSTRCVCGHGSSFKTLVPFCVF